MKKLSEKEPKRNYSDFSPSLLPVILRFKDIFLKFSDKFDEVQQSVGQSIEQQISLSYGLIFAQTQEYKQALITEIQ